MAQIKANYLVIRKALNGPRAIYTIAKHPKLYLAADGKGGGSWRIKYQPRPGAGQRWMTLSNDARNVEFDEIVKKMTIALGGLIVSGVDPKGTVGSATFSDTFSWWVERHAKVRKKSWEADVALFNRHVKGRLGERVAKSVSRQDLIAVLDDIAEQATPIQANRCQALISAVFSWALDEGYVDAHPALRIRKRGEERVRELVMSQEQLQKFWVSIGDLGGTASAVLKLLLLLGQRLGEVVGMERPELHLKGSAYWQIPPARTKNGRTHVIPLSALAVDLIEGVLSKDTRENLVFPASKVDGVPFYGRHISRQCKAIFRGIGGGDLRLHDLRHQAATGMAQCGVPLDIRQLVQNQVSGRQQKVGSRYDQHDYFEEKKRALEVWEVRLLAIVSGQEIPKDKY